MADFCTCGSLIIEGHCTNKNCTDKASKSTQTKTGKRKVTAAGKSEAKPAKTRKSSKCITYNLYDTEKEEENVN